MEHWCNWCGDFQLHNYETCPKRFPKYVYVLYCETWGVDPNVHIFAIYNSKKSATRAMVDVLEKQFKQDQNTNPPTRKEIKKIVNQHRKTDINNEPWYYLDYVKEKYGIKKVEILN